MSYIEKVLASLSHIPSLIFMFKYKRIPKNIFKEESKYFCNSITQRGFLKLRAWSTMTHKMEQRYCMCTCVFINATLLIPFTFMLKCGMLKDI